MDKSKNITVVELEAHSPEEATEIIKKILCRAAAERTQREKLADEMTLIVMEFHREVIGIAKRFDRPARELMFDAAQTFIELLRTWDDPCGEFTEENAADLEELRQQVLADRRGCVSTPERDSTTE